MAKGVHLFVLLALLGSDQPPMAVMPDDIVFEATFDTLGARVSDRDEPLEGRLLGDGRLVESHALRLEGNSRVRFDDPTMIDLRHGAASMDVSLDFDPDGAPVV